jgi:hypothetical protein
METVNSAGKYAGAFATATSAAALDKHASLYG